MITQFIQFVVSGLVIGCIYALVAIGFTVIYNATDSVNFAHGESLMLGSYFILTAYKIWDLPYPLALIVTLITAGLLGFILFDRIVSKPLMEASLLSRVIALIGVASVLKGTARLIWGADAYHLAPLFSIRPWNMGHILINPQETAVVTCTILIIGALYFFFRFTKLGKAMRATSQNRAAASLMGISVAGIFATSWILGTMLSAFAGVLLGPMLLIDPDMGIIGIKCFSAVVLGGFGSIPGSIIGGVLLGIVETLVAGYWRAEYQMGATFVLMIGVLAIRPTGLLGKPLQRKV